MRRELGACCAPPSIIRTARAASRASSPCTFLLGPKPRHRWLTWQGGGCAAARPRCASRACGSTCRSSSSLGLYTGARKAAILSLRWPQIDLQSGRLDFHPPAASAEPDKRRARIPLPVKLARSSSPRAQAWRRSRLRRQRQRPAARRHQARSFNSACKAAGLPTRGADKVTPHTLRHTCATWLMQRGVPISADCPQNRFPVRSNWVLA